MEKPIPVAARSKAWVCGRSLPGIAGSKLRRGHEYLSVVRVMVVRCRSVGRADHSSRGVLTSVVCLSVMEKY